jgi:hypothetical protein
MKRAEKCESVVNNEEVLYGKCLSMMSTLERGGSILPVALENLTEHGCSRVRISLPFYYITLSLLYYKNKP